MSVKNVRKKFILLFVIIFAIIGCTVMYKAFAANNPPKYYQNGNTMEINIYYNNTKVQICTLQLKGSAATGNNRTRDWFVETSRKLVSVTNSLGDCSNNYPHITSANLDTSTKNSTSLGEGTSPDYIYGKYTLNFYLPAHIKYSKVTSSNIATNSTVNGLFKATNTSSMTHSTSAHNVSSEFRFNLANTGIIDNSEGVRHTGVAVLNIYFTKDTYTVTYNANGGPSNPAKSAVACGNSATLPTPTRKAYCKFDGWYTAASGGTFVGNAGASYTVCGGHKTLYAHWSDYYYNIEYQPNGGSGTAVTQKVDMGGGNFNLYGAGSVTFGYANKTLTRWNTKADSSGTAYALNESKSPSNLSTKVKDTVKLYAVWVANQYNIIFDNNGGSGSLPNQLANRGEEITLNSHSGISKKGYVFSGWSLEQFTNFAQYKDRASVNDLVNEEDEVTLYAVWKKTGTGFIQRPLLDYRMFYNARSIEGQNGTTYDGNYIDSRMAHIDEDDNPGYFTYK